MTKPLKTLATETVNAWRDMRMAFVDWERRGMHGKPPPALSSDLARALCELEAWLTVRGKEDEDDGSEEETPEA